MENNTVYVVWTDGNGRGLCGNVFAVFDTEEKANDYVAHGDSWRHYQVTPFVLNKDIFDQQRKRETVKMDTTGALLRAKVVKLQRLLAKCDDSFDDTNESDDDYYTEFRPLLESMISDLESAVK